MNVITDIDMLPDNEALKQSIRRQNMLGLKASFAGAVKVYFVSAESLGGDVTAHMTYTNCLTGREEKCWVGHDPSFGMSMLDFISQNYGTDTPFWIIKLEIELNENTRYVMVQEVRDQIEELELEFQKIKEKNHGQA